jgi:PAS domain S-box-containing protein
MAGAEPKDSLHQLVALSNGFVWQWDSEARFTYCSSNVRAVLGYEPSELQGRSPWDLQAPVESARANGSRLRTAAMGREPFSGISHPVVRKDGGMGYLESSGLPRFGEDGRFEGFLGVSSAVTDKLRLQEEERRAQAMEAVIRLAGGIAHDFNNSLMAIRGYSELVLQSLRENDSLGNDIKEILAAADRAAKLSRQILALSHPQVPQRHAFDLNRSILPLAEDVRRSLPPENRLAFERESGPEPVSADEPQVRRAVAYLLEHAKARSRRGGPLTLQTSRAGAGSIPPEMTKAGPWTRLVIGWEEDGAVGEEVRSRMFEPFMFDRDQSGLSLSIAYSTIRANGGHITVVQERGSGLSFQVLLPRASDSQQVGASAHETGARETIMVVDDEPAIRAVTRRQLETHGYRVIEAASGSEALDQLGRGVHVQLVISDIMMPGISGLELAEKLPPGSRFLLMSGTARNLSIPPGGDFLEKPFGQAELISKVRAILGEGSVRPGLTPGQE